IGCSRDYGPIFSECSVMIEDKIWHYVYLESQHYEKRLTSNNWNLLMDEFEAEYKHAFIEILVLLEPERASRSS
ncbi:2736_t:CDS:2, partial [Dentiscutata erythropus]